MVAIAANAQTVTGRIVSATSKPIDRAAVYLKNGHQTTAFAFTDHDGIFSIDTKGKTYNAIEARKMGYETRSLPASDFTNGQEIVLQEKVNVVKEVVVKSQKVRQEGDTLNYLVNAFRNKQDRTLADVLKKMPGIAVNDDGSIEYQGRKINRFYIEGMDLLGSKYAQASENIDVDKVKKVQVLERHQPIKVLKNTKFSEQAALNIVLGDSAKNVWTHTADLAAGMTLEKHPDFLYDNRLVSMFFARKVQSISMYKNNNTGKNIGQEVSPMAAYLDDSAPTDGGMLSNISLPAPDIDGQRSRFNHTQLFATNWLFKTKNNNDLRVQLDAMADKTTQRQTSSTVYTMADHAVITEDVSANSHHDAINAEVLYRQNTEKQYLTNDVRGYMDFDRSNGMSQLNGVATRQQVKPRQRYLSDKLAFVRNLDGRHTISANAYLSLNDTPEMLLLQNENMEYLDKHSLLAGFNTFWGHKAGSFYLNYDHGTDAKIQRMSIRYDSIDTKRKYREWRSFFRTALSYKSDHVRFSASVPLYWTERAYEKQHKSSLTLEPNLYFAVSSLPSLSLSTVYNYSWQPNGFASMIDTPVFTDYITLRQGYGRLDNTMSHLLRANVEYKDVMKGFFAGAGYAFNNMRNLRMYAQRVVNNSYQSFATDMTSNSTAHSIDGRVSESWNMVHLITTLSGAYHWNSYNMLVDGRIVPFKMRSANVALALSLAAHPMVFVGREERIPLYQAIFKRQSGIQPLLSALLQPPTEVLPHARKIPDRMEQ